MAENVYECLFILDANAYGRDPGGCASNIQKLVEGNGGELLASRLWNEQKLAYSIRGRHKGAYWLTYVRMPGTAIAKFNRACQLSDLVLRHLATGIDPRLVDPLLAAARGETTTEETPAEASTDGAAADAAADSPPAGKPEAVKG